MTPNTISERPMITLDKGPAKGDLVATRVIGNLVELWFQSPTGDSSDSFIFMMTCKSHPQAVAIANRHNEVWGVEFRHEEVKLETIQLTNGDYADVM